MSVTMAAEELPEAERRVWEAFPTGQIVDFLSGNALADDPADGDGWSVDQQVSAKVVVALLCGAVPAQVGYVGRVALRGARITGMIDLEEAEPKHALWLDRCHVGDGINLTNATTRTVRLSDCHLGPASLVGARIGGQLSFESAHLEGKNGPALTADELTVTGSMLCDGLRADGTISLVGARISSQLSFRGAHLDGKNRPAVNADGLTVGDMTFCDRGFQAAGEIRLVGARIGGQLSFSGARLDGKNGPALTADGLTADRGMVCDMFSDQEFHAVGTTSLVDASIGQLSFSGAHLDGKNGPALNANGLTVTRGMVCDRARYQGFRTDGTINLVDASIGQLSFSGAHLDGKNGPALTADGLTVTRDMICEGCHIDGATSLLGVRIGSQLNFNGARLDGKNGPALTADGLTVTRDMSCDMLSDQGFQAVGPTSLVGASIGGQLGFRGALLDGKGGPALDADGLTVTGIMFCDRGFCTVGMTSLVGTSIGGQLSFKSARLDGKDGSALNAYKLTVTRDMFCDEGFHVEGKINLSGASVGTLVDDTDSWPEDLELDGLSYGDLKPNRPARERLTWLRRSPYQAQPYEQLATYYRQQGHDDQARRVLLAKQRARTGRQRWWARWWGWLQDGLVGYGFAPGRAFTLLALAFITGCLFFRAHHPPPVDAQKHPSFNAALYTLDLLIPAPGLGQTSDWNPHGELLVVAAGLRILGWLLAITVIAAITRTMSRS